VTRRLLPAALVVAQLAGPLLGPALAKTQKARVTALVDGKKFKGQKTGTIILYATTSFSVNTQTKPKRGISRALTINCGPGIDLRALALPSPRLACFGIYQINRLRGSGGQQTWIGPTQTMELVVDSIVDTRVTGTFRGTIPSDDPAVPPVSIEEGRFTAFIR
jgi:hypothetical protein